MVFAGIGLGAQAFAQSDPLPAWNDGPAKHDLRGKVGSDAESLARQLLGHADTKITHPFYSTSTFLARVLQLVGNSI
jgi:hypothetical protein